MRRKLSKAERMRIYNSMDGHCAYCGAEITYGEMAVDHVIPLHNGGTDTVDNMMPACRSCNHYKSTHSLEVLRESIERFPDVLTRDCVTYKIAVRFGMVVPNPHPLVFYFEKVRGGYSEAYL